MEEILFHPILWISIVVILIGVVVASIIISGKRSKEVKELDKMFPEGKLASQNLEKIPVERVRRSTMERERRKKEREKELPKRIRPKEGEKVFEEEDQEYILQTPQRQYSESQNTEPLKPRSSRTNRSKQNLHRTIDESPSSQNLSVNKDQAEEMDANQRFGKRLKPSDQTRSERQEESKSSNVNSFSKSSRSQQEQKLRTNETEKSFLRRSERKQNQHTSQGKSESSRQPFQSRSSKYSVKKRSF